MEKAIQTQPTPVAGDNRKGVLVFVDGELIVLLARLSHIHDSLEGRWHVEWSPRLNAVPPASFETIDAAIHWAVSQLIAPPAC